MSTNWTFLMIPFALNGRGLSDLAKLVYGALLLRSEASEGKLVSFMSYADLQEALEKERQSIRRAIIELEQASVLKRFGRDNGRGGGFELAFDRRGDGLPRIESEPSPHIKIQSSPHIRLDSPSLSKPNPHPISKSMPPPISDPNPPEEAPYRNAREFQNPEEQRNSSSGGASVDRPDFELFNWILANGGIETEWERGLWLQLDQYPLPWVREAVHLAFAAKVSKPKISPYSYSNGILRRWSSLVHSAGLAPGEAEPWHMESAAKASDHGHRGDGPATIKIPPVVRAPVDEDRSQFVPPPARRSS